MLVNGPPEDNILIDCQDFATAEDRVSCAYRSTPLEWISAVAILIRTTTLIRSTSRQTLLETRRVHLRLPLSFPRISEYPTLEAWFLQSAHPYLQLH